MELLHALVKDHAGALATSHRVEVPPQQSIAATIGAMRTKRCGCALVAEAGKLLGVFTERDVLTRVLTKQVAGSEPVSTVMTPNPVTLSPQDSVAQVISKMHEGGYRHLPVLDTQGSVRGVVSVKAVVNYLVEHFPAAIYNLPPDPAQRQTAREGA